MLQEEIESDHPHQNALISSRKGNSSLVSRHVSGVAQKQSLKTQVSSLPQQPVAVCRGGSTSTTTEIAAAEEENAQTSAGKASDHHSQDTVQQPPQFAPPSQLKGQNASCFNLEEDYREATQKPEAEEDEKRDVDGKSKAPQYGSVLPSVVTDDSSHVVQQVNVFPVIASVSDMPIQGFTNEGMAYVQSYVEIDPYVDRHEL